jgi:hypothetical protein
MARISDINNRIEGHMLLSDVEVSTDDTILPFDKGMDINPRNIKD